MLPTTTLRAALIFVASVLLGPLAAAGSVAAQSSEKTAVIVITVRLPADAVLMFDDHKMELTGGTRVFQTPAVPVGGHYIYVLKAMSEGKEVTRKIHIAHGMDNSFDLRAEFLAPAQNVVQAKHLTPSTNEVPVQAIMINWGPNRQTLERAFDTQPADGSRYPK
jgi:uncharacterized protein (TIGR03000 family)